MEGGKKKTTVLPYGGAFEFYKEGEKKRKKNYIYVPVQNRSTKQQMVRSLPVTLTVSEGPEFLRWKKKGKIIGVYLIFYIKQIISNKF